MSADQPRDPDAPRTRTRMARSAGSRKRVDPPPPERIERAEKALAIHPWTPARTPRVQVLFLVANSSRAPVNAEVEERKISERLKEDRRYRFTKVPDVRAEDLFQVMRDTRPAIVHFSGHGHGAAGLAMKNRDGDPTTITARELTLHFQDLAAQGIAIRCVVLNACLAEPQARAIAAYADYVVGTNTVVGDDTAVTFADNFYNALTEGRSVRRAFEAARARCGGDLEGSEKIFRLFYSEPKAPPYPWGRKLTSALGLIVAILVALLVAFVLIPVDDIDDPDATLDAAPIDAALATDAAALDTTPVDQSARAPDAAPPDAAPPDAAPKPTPRTTRPRGKLCARDQRQRLNRHLTAPCACVGRRDATPALRTQLDRDPGDCRAWYTCAYIDPGACP